MSANNQLVIIKVKNKFEIHENSCIDNNFKPNKDSLIKKEETLEESIKFANKYCQTEIVEYGYHIDDGCLK